LGIGGIAAYSILGCGGRGAGATWENAGQSFQRRLLEDMPKLTITPACRARLTICMP